MSNKWIEWMENSITNKLIKHYDYKDFNNIKRIGVGRFSEVYSANWKNANKIFVLKSFNLENLVIEEICNEVNLRRSISILCKIFLYKY